MCASFLPAQVDFVRHISKVGTDLTVEERNLMSVASKNSITGLRHAWRTVTGVENRDDSGLDQEASMWQGSIAKYRQRLETELRDTCEQILKNIDDDILPKSENPEALAFFLKMKGDYFRYIAEFAKEEQLTKATESAHTAYREALELCEKELAPIHPTHLGLALNYSVFHYEELGSPEDAIKLASSALDNASTYKMGEGSLLEGEAERQFQDGESILQLLRDNLKVWTDELQVQEVPVPESEAPEAE
eukprot:GHVT01079349.1.p1 GENE.GHVT01079349.1~~GHVT01079349.1.p1  ORF type:complete len:248 (+),score=36.86 GHVT01079349.1:446-1189(+)